MKLYWRVKIDGKWTFKAATVKRIEHHTEVTPTFGFLKNFQEGYIVQPLNGDEAGETKVS